MFIDIHFNVQLTAVTFCKYQLKIDGKVILLTFPQLLQLRKKLNDYCTPTQLLKVINQENFILLFVADNQHVLFLDIPQLLDLRYEVAFFFNDSPTSF